MHVHTARPACFKTATDQPLFVPGFREQGRYCYMRYDQASTHDTGCFGCRRAKDDRISRSASSLQAVADQVAQDLGL